MWHYYSGCKIHNNKKKVNSAGSDNMDNMEDIMLSDMRRSWKDKYCMTSLITDI